MREFRKKVKRSLVHPKTSSPVVSDNEDSIEAQAGSFTEVTYNEVLPVECDVQIH